MNPPIVAWHGVIADNELPLFRTHTRRHMAERKGSRRPDDADSTYQSGLRRASSRADSIINFTFAYGMDQFGTRSMTSATNRVNAPCHRNIDLVSLTSDRIL